MVTDLRAFFDTPHQTVGPWTCEADSASAFDALVANCGAFKVYAEVQGSLLQPRPGQVDRRVRIDRLLVPTPELVLRGWDAGVLGVEIKAPGLKLGPPLCQAADYARSVFTLPYGGVQVIPYAVFVWPAAKQHGPLLSLMAAQRVGIVQSTTWRPLRFWLDQILFDVDHVGEWRLGRVLSGTKVGSR